MKLDKDYDVALGEDLLVGIYSRGTRCKISEEDGEMVFRVPQLAEMNEIILGIANKSRENVFDVSVSYEDYHPSTYRLDASGEVKVDRYTDSNWPLALYSPNSPKYHNVGDEQRGKLRIVATRIKPATRHLQFNKNANPIPDHHSPDYFTKNQFTFEETLPGVPIKGENPLELVVFLKLVDNN